MKRIPLWIDLRGVPPKRRIPYLRVAEKVAADAVLVAPGDPEAQRDDAVVVDGDRLLRDGQPIGTVVRIAAGADQDVAAQAEGIVLVQGADWTIIPLENLIATRRDRPGTLYGLAASPEEAGVFRDTLEHGVHGVALAPRSPDDIAQADRILRSKGLPGDGRSRGGPDPGAGTRPSDAPTDDAPVQLVPARITRVEDAGPGDRICVDTTSAFAAGEGLLVGSTARSFVLVHAETIETDYVRARPFRVNAGALHSYILAADGRTQYLSELAAGSRVLAVAASGQSRTVTVGRAKLEHRPHLLVAWQGEAGKGSAVLQNAETIRLVRPDGTAVSVTELQPGQEVLVHHEAAARHFGMPVDEHLEER